MMAEDINNTYSLSQLFKNFPSKDVQKPKSDFIFQRKSLPSIESVRASYYITDPDLLKMNQALIRDTFAHRHYLFWGDDTATSFAYMSSAILVGEGLNISTKTRKAKKIIDEWNNRINEVGQTIEDYMTVAYIDNLIDGNSLWRTFVNPNPEFDAPKVDIQRISMGTVKKKKHPTLGGINWVQTASVPRDYISLKQFYNMAPDKHIEMKTVVSNIPNKLNCCLHISLFDYAPVSSVRVQLVEKKWTYWFLRKFMEKHWTPFIIGYVGDPRNNRMPTNDEEMKDSLKWTANTIRQVRDFGGAAFPATTQLKVLDDKVARRGDIYLNTIDHLNKAIAIGLYATMSLRESSGVSKAGQDIAEQGYIRTMRGFREKFANLLKKFYAEVLLPAYGVNTETSDTIKIAFSPIKLEGTYEILKAVEIAAKLGAFTDHREIRKILNPIWRHIDEDVSDKEAKDMKDLFLEINSPSRAMGDMPQDRARGKKDEINPKTDKKEPARKPVESDK
jgi:hypothetical protein